MDYFTDSQLADMVGRLQNLTTEDRLRWQQLGENQFTFVARTNVSAFVVASRDEDDLAPHTLAIYHSKPDVEKLTLLQMVDSSEYDSDFGSAIEDLYQEVKRKVLNIDVMTASIFEELERLSVEGDPADS